MARKARKSAGRKKSARSKGGAKKAGARRKSTMRATGRKSASKSRSRKSTKRTATKKQSPVARVKRVTREVVQQAAGAVSSGVETLKDFGENLVDRVRS
jgi:hypothetical protein